MRRLSIALTLGVLVAASCSPKELETTAGCTSIVDCPLDQVCSRDARSCVPEPPNRMIGAFRCQVRKLDEEFTISGDDVSEVVARTKNDRFALPIVTCYYDEEAIQLVIAFARGDAAVRAVLRTYATIDFGRNDIGPHVGSGNNAVEITGRDNYRYATSSKGYIAGDDIFDHGLVAHGYLDVELVPTSFETGRFGASCPDGLADCGNLSGAGGGATACLEGNDGASRRCVRSCANSGECLAGGGVCNFGFCTKPCQIDADCEAPLRCAAPNTAGEGRGCSSR